MPTYDYKCDSCGKVEERVHFMQEIPQYTCLDCGTTLVRLFTLNTSGFIFRGGTETINWKEKRHHLKISEKLAEKQKDKVGPKLRPNIAGVEVDSWKDAQKLAKEAGMNHESYTPYVEKEKKPLII